MKTIEADAKHYRNIIDSNSAPIGLSTCLVGKGEFSWKTEVWCADAPIHLIHFNGERFLDAYEKNGQ